MAEPPQFAFDGDRADPARATPRRDRGIGTRCAAARRRDRAANVEAG